MRGLLRVAFDQIPPGNSLTKDPRNALFVPSSPNAIDVRIRTIQSMRRIASGGVIGTDGLAGLVNSGRTFQEICRVREADLEKRVFLAYLPR